MNHKQASDCWMPSQEWIERKQRKSGRTERVMVVSKILMSQLAALCLVLVSSAALAVSEEKEIERGAKEHQKIVLSP